MQPTSRIDPDTERTVRRFSASIPGRFDVAGAVVYGSRTRGTHRPDSDADLAVVLRVKPARWLAAKLEMADAAFDVLLDTGILVSPLPVSLEEWEHPDSAPNPALLRAIERDGVRL